MKIIEVLKSLILVPVLLVGVPFAFFAKLFEKPIVRSSAEVSSILAKMQRGDVSEDVWDSFLSIPIKNKELEKIREKVEVLWAYEEFQTTNEDGFVVLNNKGLAELAQIQESLKVEPST